MARFTAPTLRFPAPTCQVRRTSGIPRPAQPLPDDGPDGPEQLVVPGRIAAPAPPEGTVVFLIGMRVNHLWDVRRWVPALRAMPAMLRELLSDPDRRHRPAWHAFNRRTRGAAAPAQSPRAR